jgi:hypothetical protein
MDPRIVRRVSAFIALVLACLYIYAFVLNEPPDGEGESSGDANSPTSELLFEGVSIEGRSDGERAWRISASHVGLKDEDKRIEIGEIMHGEIYREDEVYLSFKASKGIFHTEPGRLFLSGGVDVYSEERKLLSTDELEWTPGDSMVVIPGPAEIMTEQGVVSADSLQVDVASDEICASGNLTIHEGFGGRDIVMKGGEIRFDPDSNSFEAWGGTRIEFEIGDDD